MADVANVGRRAASATRDYGRGPYRPPAGRFRARPVLLLMVAIIGFAAFQVAAPSLLPVFTGSRNVGTDGAAVAVRDEARRLMAESIDVISAARSRSGVPVDAAADANETGLIGVQWSTITTTLGDLQAKRTATNPLWGGVIAGWMQQVGLGPGDVVWATFSGSFPGLNVAVLAAAEAIGAKVVAVSSLGASTWGANVEDFTWIDMERALFDAGLIAGGSVAVTLGGNRDQGAEMPTGLFAVDTGGPTGTDGGGLTGTDALRAAARRHGMPLLEPTDLAGAVAARLAVLAEGAAGKEPRLYVNVGGGHAALGDCVDSHRWPIGLSDTRRACTGDTPGMLHVMSERGVPVLHLLNVKQLALQAGVPIDARFDTKQRAR